MSAVVKSKPKEAPAVHAFVQAVHDASARRQAAEDRVRALNRRLDAIEARALVVLAERARHQSQVTQALLESTELPAALAPQPVEPAEAIRMIKAELKNAEQAVVIAVGDERAALVHLIERRRCEALARYRAAFEGYRAALATLAAYDRIGARALTPALPSIFVSRLSIPALPREDNMNGLALSGTSFFGAPLLAERERELRRALEAEARCPLPF
jgi:hypothetical protein